MRTFVVVVVFVVAAVSAERSAVEVASEIYKMCSGADSMTSCAKPKALSWLNQVANSDVIRITGDLSIVRTKDIQVDAERNFASKEEKIAEHIMNFLESHSLNLDVPEVLKSEEARSFLQNGQDVDSGIQIPLVDGPATEGRSLVKKVIIPFLVGLKFKTSVMVPLAMALIALKTWKALTLGLLSLVLGGALFIFKLAKPKVVNYEVVHYPHHDHHHIDHHHVDHAHIDHAHAHHLQHGWGRQAADSQELAYSAFTQ